MYKKVSCPHYQFIPLFPAVHGNEPGRGKTVVPEHGNPSGFGGDELKPGLPGIQFKGIPGPIKWILSKIDHL